MPRVRVLTIDGNQYMIGPFPEGYDTSLVQVVVNPQYRSTSVYSPEYIDINGNPVLIATANRQPGLVFNYPPLDHPYWRFAYPDGNIPEDVQERVRTNPWVYHEVMNNHFLVEVDPENVQRVHYNPFDDDVHVRPSERAPFGPVNSNRFRDEL
jgi:hypothetical protein